MSAEVAETPVGRAAERVVLLDEDGHAIGTADKVAVHGPDTPLHLAFSCYVFDPTGERFLLTRRAAHKRTFGGWWTNTCCGHPAPGEALPDAVRRRVGQELGLELDGLTLLLPRFRYHAVVPDGPAAGTTEFEMCPVYVAVAPDPDALAPDPAEVDDTAWVDWAEFRGDVRAGRRRVDARSVSPWCVEQVAALPERPLAEPPADPADLPPAARF